MAKSTGIVLVAGGIAEGNEFLQTGKLNFRIIAATLVLSIIFDGIEKVNETAAVGLATIMVITALVTPINGKAPAETISKYIAKG